MNLENTILQIQSNKTYLGIELGSTRVKAVLINDEFEPIATGGFGWENELVNGYWTYKLEDVWVGLQAAYRELAQDVKDKFGVALESVGAIGFSAMMHGYLVFDQDRNLLVPFRTWRNNLQSEASEALTELFQYPIPQRWSIAHLYQAILNKEPHIKNVDSLTTLSGHIHEKLTGETVIGIGEASGMFPIDLKTKNFDHKMMAQFDALDKEADWSLEQILPKVLLAGEAAGVLTEEGARLIDPTGTLKSGIPLCPPEGDAGTGMVATNSVGRRTGNVSAGTSVFAMVVLEDDLKRVHAEIDQVTTPAGDLVAMAHANNCSSDLNGWIGLLGEAATLLGAQFDSNTLYETLFKKSLEADSDGGGLLSYGYLSGEHITHMSEGRPLFIRQPDSTFNLANFMQTHIYSAIGALKIGLDILLVEEGVALDEMVGHGGYFKTDLVGQKCMASAAGVPVSIMPTAGEGGAWGMALLASFLIHKTETPDLCEFLSTKVFDGVAIKRYEPTQEDIESFNHFMDRYKKGLAIEEAAVKVY